MPSAIIPPTTATVHHRRRVPAQTEKKNITNSLLQSEKGKPDKSFLRLFPLLFIPHGVSSSDLDFSALCPPPFLLLASRKLSFNMSETATEKGDVTLDEQVPYSGMVAHQLNDRPEGYFPVTQEEKQMNRKVNRKIDIFILPWLALMYLSSGLDRGIIHMP